MLRIAFVADTLYSASGGGILSGQYVVDRLRRDHEVVTVASDGDTALPAFQLPVRAMRETRFVMARPDREVLRDAFSQSEVVHLQFPFWLSFAALDVAKQLGLPVVAGFHVQPENALLSVGIHAAWLNNAVYKLLVKQFYDKVDAVICPTPFAEEKLRSHGLRAQAFVISNGVPPDAAASTASLEPRSADPEAPFFILAVGRLAAEKRQDVIIEAVRLSKHRDRIRLVLAGGGPRQEELERLATALPNRAQIGFLPRETLLRYFAEADLFVHASEVELEGMAVLEAMNAGLPALVARAPESAASTFALNDDFSFPAGDAHTLSARIDALIEDRTKLQAARQPYRERARLFDFDASVDKLVHVYQTVLEQRRRPLARSA